MITTSDKSMGYLTRLRRGEIIMRDANNRLQWESGKPVARKAVGSMLVSGQIKTLDIGLADAMAEQWGSFAA
jgi:hypothetical protein